MTPSTRKFVAILLAAASIAVLITSSVFMARRIGEFHAQHKRQLYAFREVEDRTFTYAGKKVSITDSVDGSTPIVLVQYGDTALKLRVPPLGTEESASQKGLPGIKPYMDWLRIVRFLPTDGRPIPEVVKDSFEGKVADRLTIVTRELPPGADPGTWGRVWRKDWIFSYHEFLPDGTFRTERLRYPSSKRWEDAKPDELQENTWELQAALLLIPKGMGPNLKPKNDALSAVGWTLPASGSSMLLLLASIIVFSGGRPADPIKQ